MYTAIVVIREPRKGYPSGGKMAGSVFKSIAEGVMALKSDSHPWNFANDTLYKDPIAPFSKPGYVKALREVLTQLKLGLNPTTSNWVTTSADAKAVKAEPLSVPSNAVPDMTGMGAKDAVYLGERLGLSVQVYGYGKVKSQSIKAGAVVRKGTIFKLILQ